MAKICILLLVLILSFSLCACNQQGQEPMDAAAPGSERSTLECTVLEVSENRLLVYGKQERDQYEIILTHLETGSETEFAEGDRLKVYYSGLIEEIYPARISWAYKIEKRS